MYEEVIGALVTSFAEVWIEIALISEYAQIRRVTSFAEVWIEIPFVYLPFIIPLSSLPSRKYGLKFFFYHI